MDWQKETLEIKGMLGLGNEYDSQGRSSLRVFVKTYGIPMITGLFVGLIFMCIAFHYL